MDSRNPLTSPPLLASAAGSASSPPSDLRADSPLTVSVEGVSECLTCGGSGVVEDWRDRLVKCRDCDNAEVGEDEHGRVLWVREREVSL